VGAAVLLLLLGVQVLTPVTVDPTAETGGLALRIARPVQAAPAPERPLVLAASIFAADRRAVPAFAAGGATPLTADVGTADEASAPAGLDAYVVLGSAAAGRARTALLRGPGGLRSVRPGQSVAGWRVAAITRDAVTFSRGSRTRSLAVGAGSEAAAADGAEPVEENAGSTDEEAEAEE
jgi:hypothetical protein